MSEVAALFQPTAAPIQKTQFFHNSNILLPQLGPKLATVNPTTTEETNHEKVNYQQFDRR